MIKELKQAYRILNERKDFLKKKLINLERISIINN